MAHYQDATLESHECREALVVVDIAVVLQDTFSVL